MEDFNLHLGTEVMVKLQNGDDPPWCVAKGFVSLIVWEKGRSFPRLYLRDWAGGPAIYFNPATLAVYLNGGGLGLSDLPTGKITLLVGGC